MNWKALLKAQAIVLIPDVAIAWLAMTLGDGETSTFWWVLIGMWTVAAFFSLKGVIAGSLLFRLGGRGHIRDAAVNWLRANKFPPAHEIELDDIDDYFSTIERDTEANVELRLAAARENAKIALLSEQGFFGGARVRKAYQDALKVYTLGFGTRD